MIKLEHVSKKFRRKNALIDINCEISNGVYGILGTNGAGKTTLMRSIIGLYEPTSGEIKCDCNQIGYLPQNFGGIKNFTCIDFLEYFCHLKKIEKSKIDSEISDALKAVNLEEQKDVKVRKLSGGMIRRLGIAQSLLGRPEVLIFDEPTVGLDPEERLRFKNLIREQKQDRIIMISTHIVEDLEAVCDKIMVMKKGRLIGIYTLKQLADIALGKVYELTEAQLENTQNYKILKTTTKNGQIYYRILSEMKLDLASVDTTIEDGYLCLISEK